MLTDDAWLTVPPEPYEYQGPAAIGAFLSDRMARRGAPLLVPTRADTQPAFGAYFPTLKTEIARLYGILVLTLEGRQIAAITWSGGDSAFAHFGLRGSCDSSLDATPSRCDQLVVGDGRGCRPAGHGRRAYADARAAVANASVRARNSAQGFLAPAMSFRSGSGPYASLAQDEEAHDDRHHHRF